MIRESIDRKRQRHQGTAFRESCPLSRRTPGTAGFTSIRENTGCFGRFYGVLIQQQGLGGGGDRQTFEAVEIQKSDLSGPVFLRTVPY